MLGLLLLSVAMMEVSVAPGMGRFEDVVQEVVRLEVAAEHAARAEILVADGGGQVGVPWLCRVPRRVERMERHVASRAGHPDPVRPDQLRILEVGGIVVVAVGVPLLLGIRVEIRVRKQAEADHAGGLAIDDRVSAVGRVRRGLIEVEAVLVRGGALAVTRFVDEAEVSETLRASAGIDDLQEIHPAVAVPREVIPERFVAARPENPGVAAGNFAGGQRDAVIHVVENVHGGFREVGDGFAAGGCLVDGVGPPAAAEKRQHDCADHRQPDISTERVHGFSWRS